jgi:hypothetical protein
MSKDAIVRQFFLDFLENLGDHVDECEELDEEECTQILADLFFDGRLEIKWNAEAKKLMLKPTIVLEIENKKRISKQSQRSRPDTLEETL